MTHGVLSLADFLSLRLEDAGEVLGCDFGRGGDGVVTVDAKLHGCRSAGRGSASGGPGGCSG